ncbi:MAG: hypothetical protein AABZ31_00500 [Bdellovibrionota bacterium]
MTLSLAAGVFVIIALTTNTSTHKSLVPSLSAFAGTTPSLKPEIDEARRKEEIEKALYAHNELYRQLESGTRSSEEIKKELRDLAGSSTGIEFSKSHLDRAYKLAMVATHYDMQSPNPYEVLFIHSFANNGLPEDAVTLYNRRIDGMEENVTAAHFVVSRSIEINDQGTPVLTDANRFLYAFGLEHNRIKRAFDMRDPEGLGGFAPMKTDAFDPMSLVNRDSTQFENGSYQQEIITADGKILDVKVTLRKTEIGTLTFEIHSQELGSKVSQNLVLVYEEL